MRIAGRARSFCYRNMSRDRPFPVGLIAIFEMQRRPCECGRATE
jgi:hypothetical protein